MEKRQRKESGENDASGAFSGEEVQKKLFTKSDPAEAKRREEVRKA